MSALAFAAVAAVAAVAGAPRLHAQGLAARIAGADGPVEVIYPSRADVCGDGEGMIAHLFGRSSYYATGAGSGTTRDGRWTGRPCEHGPARVVASVASGEVTRLRAYVGPLREASPDVRRVEVSAAEARGWLEGLIAKSEGRVAADAMVPLILADGAEPWPLFLRVARDENRSRAVRSSALLWLGNGVDEKLGLLDDGPLSDDDEMRQQAVFVLSQRPHSESVPDLIDLAKHGKTPVVRRSAIFWLGQSGDPRAADTFAELLGAR